MVIDYKEIITKKKQMISITISTKLIRQLRKLDEWRINEVRQSQSEKPLCFKS